MSDPLDHCWHRTEPIETYSNSFEISTKIICCWCGAIGHRIVQQAGRGRDEGHGPYHQPILHHERIEIRVGSPICPREAE